MVDLVSVDEDDLTRLGRRLLERAGAPATHAKLVTDHLIEASRMGVHSHGVARIPQYISEIDDGTIDPAAEPLIERSAPARIMVDGRRGFGQVVGMRMVDELRSLARQTGLAMVNGRHLGHTGRVGAYAEALAREGLVGIAACNGAPSGHWVAPFGGRDGRISTNPLAFAWPVAGAAPVVADFSTGATAEGVIRGLRDQGKQAPEGMLRDADGRPSRDPSVLYGDPRGAIQPLGGALGYRGTALGLLVEVLTTLLDGDHVADATRKGTDMALIAISPQPGFAELGRELSAHVRASAPIDPHLPVLMPGDREHEAARVSQAIAVAQVTWRAIGHAAQRWGIELPPTLKAPAAPGP